MEAATVIASLLAGFAAGLRCFTPLALLSASIYFGRIAVDGFFAYLGAFPAFLFLSILALGELLADKSAFIPNRTEILPLIGRMISGGIVGYALAISAGASAFVCSTVAAAGAIAGTHGGFAARRYLTKIQGVPDLPVALVEDIFCISLAAAPILFAR